MFSETLYYFVFLYFYFLCQVSTDVCQLRLDFQTFSGFSVSTAGVKTDYMTAAGQTGKNPPTISGTNTGYHSKIYFYQLERAEGLGIRNVNRFESFFLNQ